MRLFNKRNELCRHCSRGISGNIHPEEEGCNSLESSANEHRVPNRGVLRGTNSAMASQSLPKLTENLKKYMITHSVPKNSN